MSSSDGSSPRAAGPRPRRRRRSKRPAARKEPPKYYFDEPAADRVCQFFELFLAHSKGEWAGQPFLLGPWQREILRKTFGWKRTEDGLRRYRTVYIRVPKKNGKSTLAAGIALYLLFADGEPAAEIYGVANDRPQAGIIFGEASRMVKACVELRDMSQVYTHSIVVPETLASYQALSSESGNKDGLNTHGLIVDELHEFNDRKLWGTLQTSMAARRQPLTVITTTAGVGRHTLYAEIDKHARDVAAGLIDDDTFLPVLFGAEPEDDWHDPEVWKKANPNYGVSVKPRFLEEEHRKAVLMPGYENAFKRYHLNLDTEQDVRWLPMDVWDACAGEVKNEDLADVPCWVALDLSRRTDLTAMVAVWKVGDRRLVQAQFFMPKAGLADRERRDGVPYAQWAAKGLITLTEGNVIDYAFVRERVHDWGRRFQVREIAYDPWGSTQLALQLQDDGLTVVEHRQGYASMSEPSKQLEADLLAKKIAHGGHPVLRWMASNAAIEQDPTGNIKPSKRKSTARIDGIVALVMALGRATLGDKGPSVYEQRGLVTL